MAMSELYVLPEVERPRPLRVAHYGTGATGRHALRFVIERPDLELVAHLVHTDSKAGRDSGEIIGLSPVGVRATDNMESFLANDADCVLYCAGSATRALDEIVAEMSRMLEAGKNVVSITVPQAIFPSVLPPALHDRLANACEAGLTSFFMTGQGPGFTTDVLSITASSISDRVERIEVSERILGRTYPYVDGVFEAMGFGRTTEQHAGEFDPEFVAATFSGGIAMMATALGVQLDEIRGYQDVAVTPKEFVAAGGRVPAGTIGSIRFRVEGVAAGKVVVDHHRISSASDEPIDDWEPQIPFGSECRHATRIVVHASPKIQCDLQLIGEGTPGEEITAARAVNAIRPVCEAPPGVKSPLDLPLFGGAHF
jgi:hypothetical protein